MSFGAGVASAGGPAVTDGLKQPQVSAVTDALAQHLAGRLDPLKTLAIAPDGPSLRSFLAI